jgi:transcriptional regulator with XRE-family HTH domain
MASSATVLRPEGQSSEATRSLFGSPTRAAYRSAIAAIIRDLKAIHGLSNERLAERLRCSESTVFNAENENGNMEPVTLLTIAFEFGERAIDPVRQLYLCAPVEQLTVGDRLDRIEREAAAIRKEMP